MWLNCNIAFYTVLPSVIDHHHHQEHAPSWSVAGVAASPVQWYGAKFVAVDREVVSNWQSRNNGSKNTCMVHSAVCPRDITKKRRRLSPES